MKCKYTQCKLGGEVEKNEAIKVGSSYYHKECNDERLFKQQIEKKYYEKFQTKEPIIRVRDAINKYIHKDIYKPEYILFVLDEDIKLNSMFGLIYYLSNNKFLEKYNRQQAKLIKFEINKVEKEESNDIKYKTKKRNGWGDIICK